MGIFSWFKSKSKEEQEQIEDMVEEISKVVVKEKKNKAKMKGKNVTAKQGKPYRISSRNMARAKSRIIKCRRNIKKLPEGQRRLEFEVELKRWVNGMREYKKNNEITENIVDDLL